MDKKLLNSFSDFIAANGGAAYLVGGTVRDELMGRESKDTDIEVFLIPEDKLQSLLEMFVWEANALLTKPRLSISIVGKSFKVFKIRDSEGQEIDVSLPRRDVKVTAGHKGFEVTSDPFMSIKEAASRRDFTINAIYKEIPSGTIIDPFNGEADIRQGIVRMVDENAFAEDPLRVLRAVQFSARFYFWIDPATYLQMCSVNLSELPAERIFIEMEKLLMQSEKPSFGLNLCGFPKSNNLSNLFPELSRLVTTPQDPKFHPEGSVFRHTMMVVDETAKLIRQEERGLSYPEKLTVMLASLTHDFGKYTTTVEDPTRPVFEETSPGVFVPRPRITAHNHDNASVPLAERFLDRLNVHTVDGFDVRGNVLSLVRYHLRPPQLFSEHSKNPSMNCERAFRRLSTKVRMDLLSLVSLADMLGRNISDEEKQHARDIIDWFDLGCLQTGVEKSAPEPLLRGRDLIEMGMQPGPTMGEVLKEAYELQLDGKLRSLYQARDWAKTTLAAIESTINATSELSPADNF